MFSFSQLYLFCLPFLSMSNMSDNTRTTHIVYFTTGTRSATPPRIHLINGKTTGHCYLAKTDEKAMYERINLDSIYTLDGFSCTSFHIVHETGRFETTKLMEVMWYLHGKTALYGKYLYCHAEKHEGFLYASKLTALTACLSENGPGEDPPAYEETNSHIPEELIVKCTHSRVPDYSLSSFADNGHVKQYRFTVVRQSFFRCRYFSFEIQCPTKCQIQVVHSRIRYHSNILEAHKRRLHMLLVRSVGSDRWLLPITATLDTSDNSVKVHQGECRYLGLKFGPTLDLDSRESAPKSVPKTGPQLTPSWGVPQTPHRPNPQSTQHHIRRSNSTCSDSGNAAMFLTGFGLGLFF